MYIPDVIVLHLSFYMALCTNE